MRKKSHLRDNKHIAIRIIRAPSDETSIRLSAAPARTIHY